jgi:hypothetical protein
MTRDEIAIKLSQITGKPIEEFLDVEPEDEEFGEQNSEITNNGNSTENRNSDDDTDAQLLHRVRSIKNSDTLSVDDNLVQIRDSKSKEYTVDDKFGGHIINGKVIGGRQMTRKEYLKYTKELTSSSLLKHKYLYKMFRAEKQNEVFFHRWIDSFPKE